MTRMLHFCITIAVFPSRPRTYRWKERLLLAGQEMRGPVYVGEKSDPRGTHAAFP